MASDTYLHAYTQVQYNEVPFPAGSLVVAEVVWFSCLHWARASIPASTRVGVCEHSCSPAAAARCLHTHMSLSQFTLGLKLIYCFAFEYKVKTFKEKQMETMGYSKGPGPM